MITRSAWFGYEKVRLVALSSAVFGLLAVAGVGAAEKPAAGAAPAESPHFQTSGKAVAIIADGIHDPANTAAKTLQEPVDAMTSFPRDNKGITDWVKALTQGMISPRGGLQPGREGMQAVDLDVVFKNTGSLPNVVFPHRAHTEWLTCANCHPAIFLPQQGGNPVTMTAIYEGKYCGVCHGTVAFPTTLNCERCHSAKK